MFSFTSSQRWNCAHLAGFKCHCLQGKWKWRNTLLGGSNIYPHHIAGHRASFRNTDEKSYPPFTGPLFIKHLLCAMHGSRRFDTAVNSCRSHVANILVEKDWWQPNKSVCQGVVRAMKKSQARSRIREWWGATLHRASREVLITGTGPKQELCPALFYRQEWRIEWLYHCTLVWASWFFL